MSDVMFTVREAGDSALLVEFEAVIDATVNARAIALASAIREAGCVGVRDVVPTYRSVAVHFDPLRADVEALVQMLELAQRDAVPSGDGPIVDVPVWYGGESGPDLDAVAAVAGIDVATVIRRHSSRLYRVFMLGFLPGFPYMGVVDHTIAVPRRPTPRLHVPAGSVGIAGGQTGIYPRDSPGGWQIIGRTPLPLFDPLRASPATLAPGHRVRFVPQKSGEYPRASPGGYADTSAEIPHARLVTVLRPGILTTVQDSGRWGYQAQGVPVSGPMDSVSSRVANQRVGNEEGAAVIETTLSGLELRLEQDTTLAVAGADLGALLDGVPIPSAAAVSCRTGSVVRFADRARGGRAYIAFDGGVATPQVLGSRATHVVSGLGGIRGRALKAEDRIPIGVETRAAARGTGGITARAARTRARLRVMRGPQAEMFTRAGFETLLRARYTIGTQSDRMGYRLVGGPSIERAVEWEMISDATFTGAIQVPPGGDPILLMADRQTTGGYPQIATVITADLPMAGQLVPGDSIEFDCCTRVEAIAALVAEEAELRAVR